MPQPQPPPLLRPLLLVMLVEVSLDNWAKADFCTASYS
jgi:hypothetical protein